MEELIRKLEQLEQVSTRLEPTPTERETYNHQVTAFAAKFIQRLATDTAFEENQHLASDFSISGKEKSMTELLDIYHKDVVHKGLKPASGGHVAYIPGGGIYTAALGDYLADITNEYAGMFYASPGAVTIENSLIDWMKSVFGFPETAVGNLSSGGSIANLIALTAARDKHGIKSEKIKSSVIYLSEQVHHCINKAIRIIGLEDVIIRYVPLDDRSKMRADVLQQLIIQDKDEGLNPFLVIASAGTTDTGAIDPLRLIGEIAEQHGLWYHVDGAYGGFFILVDEKKSDFDGIQMADSLVIDPHKGLFLPYGTGAVLVKDAKSVYHSHHYVANYMQDAYAQNIPVNPADVSPELTKHFRGLRMWLPLQLHGLKPFVACLEEKLVLTEYFRRRLSDIGFELGPEPELSVSYYWYPTQDRDENEFNKELMARIHKDGSVFLSSTTLNGKFVIRMAILSFRTKKATIDRAIDMIIRCLSDMGVDVPQTSIEKQI